MARPGEARQGKARQGKENMDFFFGIISLICGFLSALQFRQSGKADTAREDINALELGTALATIALVLSYTAGRWP